KEALERPDFRIAAMGSGSDYSAFLQHLGMASLDIRYGGEGEGGSYHSAYDSFDHFRRFIDPGFTYGVTLAQTTGRILLRLANAELLPFEFSNLSETLGQYEAEVKKLADDMRAQITETNRLIDERIFDAVYDPTIPSVVPKREPVPPFLNFAPLDNALVKLQASARSYNRTLAKLRERTGPLGAEQRNRLNDLLRDTEHQMLSDTGLPRRPWYRHLVYAPGFYTGYGVKTLPGIREAIEGRRWE